MQSPDPLDKALVTLEARLDPLFTRREYRRFFEEAHTVRMQLRAATLPPIARTRLTARLNELVERAKLRQDEEFQQRRTEDKERWRGQLARAEAYAAALRAEIGGLLARGGDRAALARWQDRARQKEERLRAVEATVADLQRKLAETTADGGLRAHPAASQPPTRPSRSPHY